jgi:hypothetical protein
MRIIKKTVVAVAAAGFAVFAAVAAGGGVAHAATNQSSTGCSVDSGLLVAALVPDLRTAVDSTVNDPTSFKITANRSIFNVLGGLTGLNTVLRLLGQTLGVNVTYTLECSVDGSTANYNGSFTATSATQSQTVNLQTAVGSPVPNSCVVHNLKATSLVSLNSGLLALPGLNDFTIGATATADTAVPAAVWQMTGKNSLTAPADTNFTQFKVSECDGAASQRWAAPAASAA